MSTEERKALEDEAQRQKRDDEKKSEPCIKCCPCYVDFSEKVKDVVESKSMTYFVVGLILANSALMASEMYEQEAWLGEF